MKLVCDARALRGALDLCTQVVPAKTTLEVLKHTLLEACADGTFRLTATDLTVQVRSTIPATVDAPGSVLVPTRYCADWLDEVDDIGCPAEIDLGEQLSWRVGPYRMRTKLFVETEFPAMAAPDPGYRQVTLDAAALISVTPALLAVARGRDDRVHIMGEGSGAGLYTIGPNQAALAVLRNNFFRHAGDWCFPSRALSLLPKTADGNACIAADEHAIVLSIGDTEIIGRLDTVIKPVSAIMDLLEDRLGDQDFEIGRRDLTRLVGAGALLQSPARLSYQPESKLLQIHADGGDGGHEARAEIEVAHGPSRPQHLVIDCEPLARLIASLPGDLISMSIGNEVFGGPGVRVWPTRELPDGARVLHGMRGR